MTIKVALVGLSASSASSWAGHAHLPYLISARGRARFQIVALLNSSEDAGNATVAHYKLAKEGQEAPRAYGDADKFAADIASGRLDVDLVVVSTRVDVHYRAILPTLKALAQVARDKKEKKKSSLCILVEWPLASSIEEARELTELAAAAGLRTAVSLQGRLSPAHGAVRDVVASGRLGRILSSDAVGFSGALSRAMPEHFDYYVTRRIGGNFMTIGLGHVIDAIQSTIGEPTNPQVFSQLQYPNVDFLRPKADGSGFDVVQTIKADVPDFITVSGTLAPLTGAAQNAYLDGTASLQVSLRPGDPFPGQPAFDWTVTGDKGKLRFVSEASPWTQAFSGGNNNTGPTALKLSLHEFATNEVTEVPWQWQDWQSEIESVPARNIGALYEALAEGKEDSDASRTYVTFADALARQQQLESFYEGFSV